MLIKARGVPIWIQCLEALLKLLPQDHRLIPDIRRNLKYRRKGYKGEKSSDYYAQLLDPKHFLILHDLCLDHNGLHFQIDSLILTTRFIIVIEIKTLEGELFFNGETGQLTVSRHETISGADNPLVQALNHCNQLKDWLITHKLKDMSMEHLAIISNTQSVIRCSNRETANHVGTDKSLPLKVMELSKRYKKELLTDKELKRTAKALKKAHSPKPIKIMDFFKLNQDEFLTGNPCPNCDNRPMKRKKAYWQCLNCHTKAKDVHKEIIAAYLLIISPVISVKECCRFLHLPSSQVARRLLVSMGLVASGINKGRVYSLKPPK
ncbi:nuclease-related domain-containing protein [Bacillus sp. FJAT-27445]|uniref:nuclease-related domain-containing protein n=1 Tax=Bacillus sp. FJAT-27445 TaxID=1679166 RepID=UPI0007431FAF|nr:nuclease-related domain-containing protein [Bacillus sp. FJAT-27445]